MLFTSIEFVFAFLPGVAAGYYMIARWGGREAAMLWLAAASLFFYAWWNPPFLALLVVSVGWNYGIGQVITRRRSRAILALGIAANLGLIAYFKYANLAFESANGLLGTSIGTVDIVLPLAISFFTFQQIAYLVDVYHRKVSDTNFVHYVLFVSFFPQLIAGPIVHHGETIPQFAAAGAKTPSRENLVIGGAIFILGLYKKIVIADGLAIHADLVFDAALAGEAPDLATAWGGALAYTLQLYFDFSGYSDMAIGLARMFGIRLPLNFDSPYKAVNIIDFWRRWHMTLSRFLRDYLYIPLGGNRKGSGRRIVNLMITMLLGGLWHGAGWTYVFWGGLHGVYLIINQAWRELRRLLGGDVVTSTLAGRGLSRAVTFLAVVVAWVFFRAGSWDAALHVLEGMTGLNGLVLPPSLAASALGVEGWLRVGPAPLLAGDAFLWIAVFLVVVWFAPSTQDWFADWRPALRFRPARLFGSAGARLAWLIPFVATSALVGALIVVTRGSEAPRFIYTWKTPSAISVRPRASSSSR